MTFRVRHEWPEKSTRIVDVELVTCPHCRTLRITDPRDGTRYVVANEPQKLDERDRVIPRLDEPPCIEPPPPPRRAPGDGARAKERANLERVQRELDRETLGRDRERG